ncbi:MAG: protein phosphatase 2C domain-containing protein [Thermoplasmataceae archaeon]
MNLVTEAHRPKLGNDEREYEDAFYFSGDRNRYAIADGASDSVFSGIWARNLVKTFVNQETRVAEITEDTLHSLISSSRDSWYRDINWDQLSLFVKNKAVKGSFSTFLGMDAFRIESKYRIDVVAVGDSCIFFHHDSVLKSFPIDDPSKFGNTPNLLWSGYGAPFTGEFRWKKPKFSTFSFDLSPGDSIILATDALAKWMLENSETAWDSLMDCGDYLEFFDDLRRKREMRNDDITMAMITLDS